jgi:DNA-binding MarR family transcriptional regulator
VHISEIDPLLGTPARLVILATVADGQRWTFRALREATGLADGNLHVQAGKLVAAGYLASSKRPQGGRTITAFELTSTGRQVLRAYVQRFNDVVVELSRRTAARRRSGDADSHDGSRVW